MNHRVNRLVIRTPEGCSFSLLLAGPVSRFLAWLLDLFIVIAAAIAALQFISLLALAVGALAVALYYLLFFAIWFGYGIITEWFFRGRTFGKKIFGLRVMDEHGLRLTFSQIVIRNLLRFADMLPGPYLVGGITCLLTRRSQRLGDLAAGTVVVRTAKAAQPDLSRVLSDKFNSFHHYPHIEARLRQRVSPTEARIALQTLLRRDNLDPVARVELFARIADHFKSIVSFPQETHEGLSDEQYVRNAIGTLFRTQTKTVAAKK
jgi:uncharacterized RDD family membrane protein YckC